MYIIDVTLSFGNKLQLFTMHNSTNDINKRSRYKLEQLQKLFIFYYSI